jgi:hypothetical protein
MQPEQDTPQGETAPEVIGNPEPASTPEPQGEITPEPTTVDKAEFDRLQKEHQKLQMELNQNRNKLTAAEKAAEESRLAKLSEDERIREERDNALRRLEELEQQKEFEEQQVNARKFREQVIGEYPEAVQKAAKALLDKNPTALAWAASDDGVTEEQARQELKDQLDTLASFVGVGEPTAPGEKPKINANNPGDAKADLSGLDKLKAEAVETGDWTKYIQALDSVKAQVERVAR